MLRSRAVMILKPVRPLIHGTLAASVMLAFAVTLSWSGAAQQAPPAPEKRKLSKDQQRDVQTLVAVVDKVSQGEPAPSDVTLAWTNDFLKAQEGRTYVPFTLAIPPGTFATPHVAMYLRVVNRSAAPPPDTKDTPDRKDTKKDEKKGGDRKNVEHAFEDIHFLMLSGMKPAMPAPGAPAAAAMPAAPTAAAAKPAEIRVSRAFAVPGGEYDVYLAMKEQGEEKKGQPPLKIAAHKQALTVPDFWTTELTTSTVIIADKVEPMTAALSQEQQAENPYTFGSTKITPATDTRFAKTEELSILFIVYNTQLEDVAGAPADAKPSKKPNVTVEYNFHRKAPEGEKFFNRTSPQEFNHKTLPPQFDLAAGHQLVAGQTVPLASFPDGDYRLEIKIMDNISKQTVTRELNFTVGTGPA
ncbi:MAG: hypothetical protein HY654_13685 [Acidobacteria bacterium]|nr:hypothetical protein [Acidobacteriota bacterium]